MLTQQHASDMIHALHFTTLEKMDKMGNQNSEILKQDGDSDPFKMLFPPPKTIFYISGGLRILRVPEGSCGDWLNYHGYWYRVLNAHAFLCLRQKVQTAIESSETPDALKWAVMRLEDIRQLGVQHNSFIESEVAETSNCPQWYSFHSGCPIWVDAL